MLRKVFHIVLTLLLVFTTAGFTVSEHFCENRLVSVSVNGNPGTCGHSSSSDCCHNYNRQFQVKDDFTVKKAPSLPDIWAGKSLFPVAFNLSFHENTSIKYRFDVAKKIPDKQPPNLTVLQQFLL